MIDSVLTFFSHYLIEFMGLMLSLGLVFRFLSYRSSRLDDIYFSTLSREIDKVLEDDRKNEVKITNAENYVNSILSRVENKLPNRSLRFQKGKNASQIKGKNVVSLRDYVGGQKSLINSINMEVGAFKCPHPPNVRELTQRIMNQDKNWVNLLGVVPIDSVSRMIDILPGLFIVFGVFGTFIGIAQALPEIAKIDFNNLESSGVILSTFVKNVTFAMKTSIAGILFSLILTLLNTMFPISKLRQHTFKKMCYCFESIWMQIHGGSQTEKEMTLLLSKILDSMNNYQRNSQTFKKSA